MSEENRNEERLDLETATADATAESDISEEASSQSTDEITAAEADDVALDQTETGSAQDDVDSHASETQQSDAEDAAAEVAETEEAVSDAVEAEEAASDSVEAEEAASDSVEAEEAVVVDLSHMSWSDRVEYNLSLGTLDGYAMALRLIDFNNPSDIQLAETWGIILNAHPEMAGALYDAVGRMVTSDPEVWSNILEAHRVALENADDDGRMAIGEVIGKIQCLRTQEVEDGKAQLSNYESSANTQLVDALAIVATGNWRKVETTVEAQVRETLSDDNEVAVETAHRVADLALSAKALDRAVEMMRRTSRKITDNVGLKWRLAILSRDQQKWNAYVDVLAKDLINVTEQTEIKVDIYNEMIRVYRDETKQEAMVVKTYEALLNVDPTNTDALENLVAIYEKMRRWPDLIKILEAQAEKSDDVAKVDYYLRIAKIYLEKLSRKVDAIKYFENVLSVEPQHEESLEQLKALYTERRDWEKLIEVHRKELTRLDSVVDQIDLLKNMADIAKTKLRNNGISIEIWNEVLTRDPQNAEAIAALETLYEGEKRWSDLAGIMERKIELCDNDADKFQILQKLGALYSDRANDNVSAIATWRRVLAIDPSFTKAVDALRKLLIEERDWESLENYYAENDILPDVVKLFEQLSKTLKDDADKKAVLLRAAHVYENSLSDSDQALATLEKILVIDPKDADVAKELVEYYEPRAQYEDLAKMLEIIFNSCERGEERSAYGLRLAKLFENKLANDRKAYEWYLRTVKEDIHYEQAFDGLVRSAGKTGNAQKVVDLFRSHLDSADDVAFRRELQYRIGCLLLEYLNGSEEAQKIFEALLEEDPEDIRALGALENILEREGRFNELLEVNERRMKLAKSPEDLAETLLSGARIHENHLNDKLGAIESYERVCELLPEDTRPLVELHRLYAETEDYEKLARIIEKQLELLGADHAFEETRTPAELNEEGLTGIVYGARLERNAEENTAEWVERTVLNIDREAAVALWFELGEVYRNQLSDYDASVVCYDNILLIEPEHEGSISGLETLLENGVGVEVACRALSKVYALQEKYAELKNVLVRLAEVLSVKEDKISYYVCASQICSELLEDADGAQQCLSHAMACNPASDMVRDALLDAAERYNAWENVIAILENVANSVSKEEAPELATQYALQLSSLWENQLDNREKAIAYGQKALEIGGKNQEVLDYLKETFIRLESWNDVIAVLKAESLLTEDEEQLLQFNLQIASIQENSLSDNAAAIETMHEILEKHPENKDVLAALDRLYVACERWEEAVANCERQLELETETTQRDTIESHMASILSSHLNEADRAFEIYSGILSHDPQNALAVDGLEQMVQDNDGVIVEQIAELLLPIYDATDNWERRCWMDEQLLRVVVEPERRRDLLHEIASLYETRGEDHEKAYDAYARSLKEDLRSQETIEQLCNYADVLDKWADLVKVMEESTIDADDVEAAKNIDCMVAEIYRQHIGDIDAAIKTYVAIREKDPEDIEILNALDGLYREKEAWPELTEVLMVKAKLTDDPMARKELLFQAAAINEEILNQVDDAIAIYTDILADEAGEPTALDSLERLYTGKESWQELLGIYVAKNEIAEDDETRTDLLFKMGALQETKLNDNTGAIETYQRILDIDSVNAAALEALDRLYLATNDMTSLLEILERREAIEENDAERVNFKFRQAECWYRNMDDLMKAIEVYHAVLEMDAAHEGSIASLEEIIGLGGEAAIEAAKVLVPVYQTLGRWAELVKVYEVLVAGSEDTEEAIALLSTIGTVEEEMLQNNKAAFDAWYRALSKDVTREDSWQKVESLAETCECWQELVERLDELGMELASDATSAIIVAKHQAAVYEQKLEAPAKAIEALQRVLELDSNDIDAIHGLDHLYEIEQKWQELSDILHTEIDIAETDEERLNAYYRLGAVQEMYLENYEEAVASYNEMHLIIPGQPEALESLIRMFMADHCCAQIAEILEAYYRSTEDWEQLVNLDLLFVDKIEDHNDRYDKFIEIADVYLNNLSQIPEGLAIYGRALAERPGDELCLTKIDELSEIIQDWTNNVVYYKNAIDAADDDVVKQDLTLRMAQTYDRYLEDFENAEKCYLGVLAYDAEHLTSLEALDRIYAAQQRWQDLVAIIRREIPVVDSDDTRIALYMRLGAVLNEMLADGDGAIAAYNEILNIDPAYWDALTALENIYQVREDWTALDDVYDKEAAASNDDQQRVELWGKRAVLNSETLNKPDDAIDLWYQVLDVLGDNLIALQNLETLFIRAERWADVADVVERQVPLTTDNPELNLETYRKLGRIYRDKLEDDERSLDFWRNALEVVPTDLETLRAIEALDEKLDNMDDLASILMQILQSNQLSLEDQLACAVKLAGILDNLGRVDDTINIWNYVVQLDATNMQALDELQRLYEGESRWDDVVNTLRAKIDVFDNLEDKVALYNQIANIWEIQVGDIDKAAAAYMAILDLDPARNVAFDALEELYTNHERWQELLSAYVERAEIIGDPQMRLDLLKRGAKIAEEKMEQPDMAFAVLQSAIDDNWKNNELMAEVERLAEVTAKWAELVAHFENLIANTQNPVDALALHNIVARWYFHHLNDNESSWNHFAFVLDQDPKNLDALAAMSEIFRRIGNWDELVNYLVRRLDLTTITDDRVTLLLELADVYETKIGDLGQAIDCYMQAYKLTDERLDVMMQLARIYEAAEQWPELIEILEKETTVIDDDQEKINVRYKIGAIWEQMLQNPEKAAEAYAQVVEMDDTNADALRALERIDITLERWQDLIRVYGLQLSAFAEPEEQIAIYSKASQVYEQHLDDIDNAIASMIQITLIDSANIPAFIELERLFNLTERWQDLIDTYNTHIANVQNPVDRVELYRALGNVYRTKQNDISSAIEAFQAIIDIVPNDTNALYALADLYQESEDYVSTIEFLNRVIGVVSDLNESVDVRFRVGSIYEQYLQDEQAAEEQYRACIDANPAYMSALDALSALYTRHEDWQNLILILKQKVDHTRELDDKAQIDCLLGDVSLHKIDDPVNAYAYYNEALSLQPNCVAAAWPLAEKYLADKAYARALVLFEIVINGISFTGTNSEQLYDLNYKAGLCCQQLSQHEKALEFFRASYELNQNYPPTLMGMGEELLQSQDYDRAYRMFQSLLENFSAELQPEQVIEIYYHSAIAKKATGELVLARQLLERILEADGSQTKSLELIIDVCEDMGDWEALVYYMSIHIDRQNDKDLKFDELMKLASIYDEKIGDHDRQIDTYYKALEVNPSSRIVLNKLLEIYRITSQWENAIAVIEKLCESTEDIDKRTRYEYTIAVIYRDELNYDDKAIEYFNRALDTNHNELRAFEAIDRILTSTRAWEQLSQNYLRMLQRVNKDTNPNLNDTKRQLWYGLGEIYRTRLTDWASAVDAFKKAIEFAPNDEKLHHILFDLYFRLYEEHRDVEYGDDAIVEIRKIIDLQSNHMTPEQEQRNYRALYRLYRGLNKNDEAWCISDILGARGFNLAGQDIEFHDSVEDQFDSSLQLKNDDFKNYLLHPSVSVELTDFLRDYYSRYLRRAFCFSKLKDVGTQKSEKLKYAPDTVFWQCCDRVRSVLGFSEHPEIYRGSSPINGMAVARLEKNTLLVAQDMFGGRTVDEYRFIVARTYLLLQQFFVAAIGITPRSSSGLKLLIEKSIPALNNAPKPTDPYGKKIYEEVKDSLPKQAFSEFRAKQNEILTKGFSLSTWFKGVEFTCDRFGLLLCSNFAMACNCINSDAAPVSKLTAEERITELSKFAISDEYFELRKRLGITVY